MNKQLYESLRSFFIRSTYGVTYDELLVLIAYCHKCYKCNAICNIYTSYRDINIAKVKM